MGSLFVTTYSLALADPVPHRIDAAVVGDPASHAGTIAAVQAVARDSLVFERYGSTAAALHAMDEQDVYAALDLTPSRPTLYLASAAGASVDPSRGGAKQRGAAPSVPSSTACSS